MTSDDPEVPPPPPSHEHVDGALMISWGPVIPGREELAVASFTDWSRYLGHLLTEEVITAFKPYFFADGPLNDVVGFFIMEGRRAQLDELRRNDEFVRRLVRAGAAISNLRVHTLQAGSEAGRLVNLYREVRSELGLL